MTKFIVILIGLGALAQSAVAATEIDANGDGLMTIEEVRAVYPEMTAEVFSEIDANGDGALDDDEMVAGQENGLIPAATDG
ncbi:EF-hand domain-containing protein [Pseudohalocynthiibacter aestuariivivens]|uniref:EF-hand domain-containing protein n=1 Tax=Roseovarius pelagicus TaxID=2980108 RepID=A0ABY6DJ02_9RHOB|nr:MULTISPECIES: EF-hand domain-containing protein [Rhodobacterales]QIE44318.1 EF-hand domain-containing protein [Pseudohalocynthiibacter aestuariivivens]UXX83765.1 EF-hand domain-containing protein [Roseovarius pelagicus]